MSACLSCAAPGGLEVGGLSQPVLYGADGRVEVEDLPDAALRAIADSAVVAILPRSLLQKEGKVVKLAAPSLGDDQNLCPNERFADQPAAAACSGVLLGPQLVLTAGHCARRLPCDEIAFVFGYQLEHGAVRTRFDAEDVYGCDEVVERQLSLPGEADRTDFAWVRLDRDAGSHAHPIALRDASSPLADGEAITVIGHGSGLPRKAVLGGHVADPRAATSDYFISTSDTFHGDSGAPVFDEQRRLIGIQVRGNEDYVPTANGCNALARLPDDDAHAGEQNTHISRALEGLCADHPDEAPCCEGDECEAAPSQHAGTCSFSPAPGAHPSWCVLLWFAAVALARTLRATGSCRRSGSARSSSSTSRRRRPPGCVPHRSST
ncbi:MAG TPA: serine protease [Polyangiales bacterium]|nr:serine protease [Polyangiales bacterium]